jgi:uncharacterized protein (DUF2249 family)
MSQTEVNELDARVIPPVDKHPTIFRTFDALANGESFVLINDHDPKPLHYQFEAERTDEYKWEYLEQGPKVFRVEISRIAEANVTGERSTPSCGCH